MKNTASSSVNSKYKWVMLALSWLAYFAFGMILASTPILVTPIAHDLTLTYSQIGFILGIWLLAYAFLAVPIGLMIDRVGTRRSVLVGVVLVSLSGLLRSFATGFETLFLYVFVFGLGGPIISVGSPKIVASWFLSKDRGMASGIYLTGTFLGSATALTITNTVILPLVGTWRNTLRLFGLVGFLIALVWLLLGREAISTRTRSSTAVPLREAITKMLKEKHVWTVAIIGFSMFFFSHGFGNWLPKFLELKGMSPAEAGVLSSVPTWCGLIGSIAIPGLGRAGSRKYILSVTLLITGICVFAAGIASGLALSASLALYGISYGMMPLLIVILMDMPQVGAKYMGGAGGMLFSLGGLGGFIGPYVVGFLVEVTGSILPSIMALTAVAESMIILALFIKER